MDHRAVMDGRHIAVFGASGHTGAFVVAELVRRGASPVLVGRDPARLEALADRWPMLPRRAATTDEPATLARAFGDVDAVVNAAGPFLDTAPAISAAAVRAGAHYLDVTAEQASAERTLADMDDAARAAGVCVLPGVGFYGGLGDLLVAAADGPAADTDGPADDVTIAIALDQWHPTDGTRRTGERNTAVRRTLRDGDLVPLSSVEAPDRWMFREPFGEQPVMPLGLTEATLLAHRRATANLTVVISTSAIADLADPTTPPPVPVDEYGRSTQRFTLETIVRRGDRIARASLTGRDIYAFTAPLVVEVMARVLAGGAVGATTPAAAVDAQGVLRFLAASVPDTELDLHAT